MSSYRMKYKIGSTQYNIPVQEDISAIPLGTILPYSANSEYPPAGFLFCDGSAVSRTMYPDLFALIGTTFGNGDGVSTFNLPDLTLGEFLEGSSVAGTTKNPGLPNIEISGTSNTPLVQRRSDAPNSVFTYGALVYDGAWNGQADSSWKLSHIGFDASKSSAIYGNSTTVQPKSVTVRYIIKAFNATTSSSELIDITQYASELNQKADYRNDWCYIYPNNGTESNPANVTSNSSYVMSNPFPGYVVDCVVEVLYNGTWGDPHFVYYSGGFGAKASQVSSGDIVIQTGSNGTLLYNSNQQGNPFRSTMNISSAPCRVKVWKVGKLL